QLRFGEAEVGAQGMIHHEPGGGGDGGRRDAREEAVGQAGVAVVETKRHRDPIGGWRLRGWRRRSYRTWRERRAHGSGRVGVGGIGGACVGGGESSVGRWVAVTPG